MRVVIPSALRSYTDAARVEADGRTLGDVLADLERRYPGIRFRMVDEQDGLRPHIRFFCDGAQLRDLAAPLDPRAELFIVQALSGG